MQPRFDMDRHEELKGGFQVVADVLSLIYRRNLRGIRAVNSEGRRKEAEHTHTRFYAIFSVSRENSPTAVIHAWQSCVFRELFLTPFIRDVVPL